MFGGPPICCICAPLPGHDFQESQFVPQLAIVVEQSCLTNGSRGYPSFNEPNYLWIISGIIGNLVPKWLFIIENKRFVIIPTISTYRQSMVPNPYFSSPTSTMVGRGCMSRSVPPSTFVLGPGTGDVPLLWRFLRPWRNRWGWRNHFLRPGKHTKSYWKWPLMAEFPINNGDFP